MQNYRKLMPGFLALIPPHERLFSDDCYPEYREPRKIRPLTDAESRSSAKLIGSKRSRRRAKAKRRAK